MLVKLVRPDHRADMVAPVVAQFGARSPEARQLDQHLRAGLQHERVVAGGTPVLPDRVGDVGRDMVLLDTGVDLKALAAGIEHKRRRHVNARVGQLPGVQGAAVAELTRFVARGGERVVAVHQQRASSWGMGVDEKRKHEDLGIPEHMPLVALAGQRAGAGRGMLVVGIGAANQMVQRKAGAALDIRVVPDHHVGACPALGPGAGALLQHRRDTSAGRTAQALQRALGRIAIVTAGPDRHQPVQGRAVPRFEVTGPALADRGIA